MACTGAEQSVRLPCLNHTRPRAPGERVATRRTRRPCGVRAAAGAATRRVACFCAAAGGGVSTEGGVTTSGGVTTGGVTTGGSTTGGSTAGGSTAGTSTAASARPSTAANGLARPANPGAETVPSWSEPESHLRGDVATVGRLSPSMSSAGSATV